MPITQHLGGGGRRVRVKDRLIYMRPSQKNKITINLIKEEGEMMLHLTSSLP